MQKNSTDDIALRAWNATKKHWLEFILFPILVTIAFGVLLVIVFFVLSKSPSAILIVSLLVYLAYFVFIMSFWTALAKWSSQIHKGAKSINIMDGLHYGLSRFWGVLGTCLLTGLKVILWMILLILPGIYKGTQYMHSIQVSQLDKVSGGDANKLSKAIIMNAGIVRSFSNIVGISYLIMFIWMALFMIPYILFVASIGLSSFDSLAYANTLPQFSALSIVSGILMAVIYLIGLPLMTSYINTFSNFQYIMFRDEQKAAFTKAKKAL